MRGAFVLAFVLGLVLIGGAFHPWVAHQFYESGSGGVAMVWFIRLVGAAVCVVTVQMWRRQCQIDRLEAEIDRQISASWQRIAWELSGGRSQER